MGKKKKSESDIGFFTICLLIAVAIAIIYIVAKYSWIPCLIALAYFYIKKDMLYRQKYIIGSSIICVFSFMFFLYCTFAKPDISSITLSPDDNQTMNLDSVYNIEYEIYPDDAKEEELTFISNNKDIITFDKTGSSTAKIQSYDLSGTATIYIKSESGITSDKIQIKVEDQEAIKKAKEAKQKKKAAEEKKKQEEELARQKEAEQLKKEQTEKAKEPQVWIPSSGSKYHSNKNCSGMKNPSQVSISDAKDMGYEACKKCY